MSISAQDANQGKMLAELGNRLRQMGIATVMFHQAIADALGLNLTDSRALSLLHQHGPMSAGELAESTGLTSSAVTTIIDRLERAKLVVRQPDSTDRRRVIVHAVSDPTRDARRIELFQSLQPSFMKYFGHFSEDDLRLIFEFIDRGLEFLREETRRLQGAERQESKE